MQQKTKNKLFLCLQEMQYIREILDIQCADDQTSRMLGLYVAMRMDDFIHMLPTYPSTNPNQEYIEAGKQEYKTNLENARNKLGAHFQTIVSDNNADESNRFYDFIERNRIFSEIDYKKVTELIDDAIIVYQIATNTEGHAPNFNQITDADKEKIEDICTANNRNGRLTVYNDYLHFSRPNSIGAIVPGKGQQKAQQLNSISMLITGVSALYDVDYTDPALKRMFKRMLICWIINFYDNLVTRPVDPSAPQFDPGLDQLLNETFDNDRTRDTQGTIAGLISDVQSLKDNQAIIDNARMVRNKACAHLDVASDVCDINTLIDSYDDVILRQQYDLWYSIFKDILKSHNILKPLLPMSRPEVYDALTENTGRKNFYGESIDEVSNDTFTGSISVEEAMAAIKNLDPEKLLLAEEKIRNILFDAKGEEYVSLCTQLYKLIQTGITYHELEVYSRLLHDTARGNPEKNQELLLHLWETIKYCKPEVHKFILWPLTANARYDKSDSLRGLVMELIDSPQLWTRLFGGLIAFHAEIQKTTSPFAYELNPSLTRDFQDIAHSIPRDNIQELIQWLVISSHWNCDTFFYQPNWHAYSEELADLLKNSCESYCQVQNLNQQDSEYLIKLCNQQRYIELLWYLIKISKQMNHHADDFLSLVENNLMIGIDTQVEIAYWSLCYEEIGCIKEAESRLRRLVEENVADKCLRLSYVKFLTRHPEYSQELEQQRKYLEDHFNLTEEDRKWMA